MNDVTDEMVEAVCLGSEKRGLFLDRHDARLIIKDALAARPKVPGDAVEAALRTWFDMERWQAMFGHAEVHKQRMSEVIEAADAARGYVIVRWRKPEEWTPQQFTAPILVSWQSGDVSSWWNDSSLASRITAWAEMPPPHAWAQTAPPVASAQPSEANPVAQATGDRCPVCDSPKRHIHPAVQYGGEVQICPHPWHTDAQTTGDAHEAPVAEPAPVFTREMCDLIKAMSSAVIVLTRHNNMPIASDNITLRKIAAFLDPAP